MDAQELRNLQEAYLEVVSNNNELSEMSYKKLPVGKMIGKTLRRGERLADTKDFYADNDVLSGSGVVKKRENELQRSRKMGEVADTHNPAKAKRKEDDNRRIGGRKRDAGRPRSNELQDNW